jgi:hypothetical protein
MLNDRELALVLAALRHWQESHDGRLTNSALWEIATDGGKFQALGYEEIERLCQRLNAGGAGVFAAPFAEMCRKVAETAANWADCSDWREARTVFKELGSECRELLESAPVGRPQRYVLYDFDGGQLVTTRVYDAYDDARADADQLQDVLIVPIAFGPRRSKDAAAAEAAEEPCACEQPGPFCCGIPGILAHFENGRLSPGATAERCDQCQRYPSDEAALARLKQLGLA